MSIPIYAIFVAMLIALAVVIIAIVKLKTSNDKSEILERELERLKMVLELSEDVGRFGTWHLKIETRTVSWSSHVFEMHHRPHTDGDPALEDAIGYYHPDDRSAVASAVNHALDQGEDFEFRARIITETGKEVPVLARGTCQFDRSGTVIGVFGCILDLSAPHGH